MRPVLAVLAAAVVAALAGLMSGEYEMAAGWLPIIVAVLLGVAESEVVLAVWRASGRGPRALAALCSGAGVAWGVAIDASGGPVTLTARLAPFVSAAAAVLSFRSSGSRGDDSPTEP